MAVQFVHRVSKSKPKYFSPQLQQTLIKVYHSWRTHSSLIKVIDNNPPHLIIFEHYLGNWLLPVTDVGRVYKVEAMMLFVVSCTELRHFIAVYGLRLTTCY